MLAVALIAWVWPTRFGGRTTVLAVDGNSMRPTFKNGDLVVARTQDHYNVGEIIIFKVSTSAGHTADVVHRIIKLNPDGTIVTQGDNRRTADSFHTTAHDVIGHAQWRIPAGAITLRILSRWWLLAVITGILVMIQLWPNDGSREAAIEPANPQDTEVEVASAAFY
jgi:signal peptidase